MQEIRVKIKGGKVEIETSGFTGGECLAATAGLKSRFGGACEETAKPEMHEQPADQTQNVTA